MSLVAYTITALQRDVADAAGTGKQVIVGATCSMFLQPADTAVALYDNAAGANGNTAKVTGSNGQVVVYVQPGQYRLSVNGINSYVTVAVDVDALAATDSAVLVGGVPAKTVAYNAMLNLTPEDFGDVSVDATAAVQAAIDAASLTGLPVYFSSKTYTITEALSLGRDVKLQGTHRAQYGVGFGQTANSTVIQFSPTIASTLFNFTKPLLGGFRFFYSISGFLLKGNSADSSGLSQYAIDASNLIYCEFNNISIDKSFNNGIKCYDTINNRFENIFISAFNNAVEYGSVATTDVWEQCTFFGAKIGVNILSVGGLAPVGIRFSNCLWEQCEDYGIDVPANAAGIYVANPYMEDVPYASNVADNCAIRVGFTGTSIKASTQLTVQGGEIRGKNLSTTGDCFKIKDTDGVNISDTLIRKYVTAIDTSLATRVNSVHLSNVTATAVTTVINDLTKVTGSFSLSQLTDVTLTVDARFRRCSVTEIRSNAVTDGTGTVEISANTVIAGKVTLNPYGDNVTTLGAPSSRWSTVYAGTGTINTSDERLKTELLDIEEAERLAAIEIKRSIRKYKFLDSVDKKGDEARVHFGVGAQTVRSIMMQHGLNAENYGFFCYDKWDNVPEVLAEDGIITREEIKAGERYGIRYSELAMFLLAAI